MPLDVKWFFPLIKWEMMLNDVLNLLKITQIRFELIGKRTLKYHWCNICYIITISFQMTCPNSKLQIMFPYLWNTDSVVEIDTVPKTEWLTLTDWCLWWTLQFVQCGPLLYFYGIMRRSRVQAVETAFCINAG